MPNFKDFVNSLKNTPKALNGNSASNELATKISSSLILSSVNISNYEGDEFGNKVTKLAHSEEVLTELSSAIGMPEETESEDEFVERAKSTLTSILRSKLLK